MSCNIKGTGDVVLARCPSCSEVEHGSAACGRVSIFPERWPTSLPSDITYRVLDDRLFVVDPGSPPREALRQ